MFFVLARINASKNKNVQMFNKRKISLFIFLAILFLPLFGSAQLVRTYAPIDPWSLVDNILSIVWWVLTALAVVLFIWAGILFLTAQGNAEKLHQARAAALWGVVGIAVMILSFSIFSIVRTFLTTGT